MRRVSSGYTIIEVLIVLGVTTLLVAISLGYMSGREGHTHFSQTMRDTQAQIQQWMDDVTNGFPTGQGLDHCTASGAQVLINPSPPSPSATPDCIFLGKAIQVTDSAYASNPSQDTQIFAYPVFGLRLTTSGDQPSNLSDVSPMPALGNGTGSAVLTETYTLGGGAYVKGVCGNGPNCAPYDTRDHLVGFYLSLNNDSNAGQNGASQLKAYQYPLGNAGLNSASIRDCINMSIVNPGGALCKPVPQKEPPSLSIWQVCFGTNSNSDTAVLTLRGGGSGNGVTTQLEFKPC